MGDKNFMGGLLGGLAQSMTQQKELTMKETLAKAQIDLIKAQGKHEEQKVNTALVTDRMMQEYMGSGAQPGGEQGSGQATGQGQIGEYPGLNSQYAKENMFYRRITGGGSLPAPNTRPTVTKLADGRILTSLNGKVLGIMNGPVESDRVMGTGPGGEPTAYHVAKQFNYPVGGQPAPGVGVGQLGPQPPQLGGGGVQLGPRPTENVSVTDASGTYSVPQYKQSMPGDAPLQTKIPERDMAANVPAEAKQKLVGMNTFVDQLEQLAAAGEKDKNLFGSLKEAQYRTGRTFVGGLPIVGDLIRSKPELASFMQLHDTVHATRLFEMGGKQATAMELQTIMNTLATTKDWETFKVQSKLAIKLAKDLREQVKTGYRETENQLLAPGKSLPVGAKPTNRTSGGKPVYQLPDGRYVVQ